MRPALLAEWTLDPALGWLALAAVAYVLAARRHPRWPAWRTGCALAGLAVGAVALASGIDERADALLSVHMVQHTLLLLGAAPLLALAAPLRLALGALRGPRRQALARLLHRPAARALSHPLFALIAFAGTLGVAHVPSVYDAALAHPLLHGAEHAALLWSAWLLWTQVVAAEPLPRRLGLVGRIGLVIGAMTAMGALGAALAAAGHVVYPHYRAPGALADQQVAAGIMWVSGMLIAVPALVAVAAAALDAEERRQRLRELHAERMALLLAVTLAVGVGIAALSASESTAASGQVAHGQALFQQSCASCHGLDARGVRDRGPTLIGVGAAAVDFYVSTGRMPLAAPGDEPVRGQRRYGRTDTAALAAYVASLAPGPQIPAVDPARGDVSQGQQLFALNCSGCHQIMTKGGIGTGFVAPDLSQATATQIAEAIRVGPYLMPRFNARRLGQPQVDSIARYITQVGDAPDNRGGWGIGNLGPVPEGLVAFALIGLVLLIAARLIGERT